MDWATERVLAGRSGSLSRIVVMILNKKLIEVDPRSPRPHLSAPPPNSFKNIDIVRIENFEQNIVFIISLW